MKQKQRQKQNNTGFRIRIFAQKNGYGLSQDSIILMRHLESWKYQVEQCDPVTWIPRQGTTTPVDIHIYMETPCALAVPWAHTNILVVNPEWFQHDAWNWCFSMIDLFVFKDPVSAAEFKHRYPSVRTTVLPWISSPPLIVSSNINKSPIRRFLYIIGGSINKTAAAEKIISAWTPDFPPLEIWCSSGIAEKLRPFISGDAEIEFQTQYRTPSEKETRQKECAWHITASCAEGFGYTMSEAIALGKPILWNNLSVYEWQWGTALGSLGRIESLENQDCIRIAVKTLVEFHNRCEKNLTELKRYQDLLSERRAWCLREFRKGWSNIIDSNKKSPGNRLPAASIRSRPGEELPKVGIVTVTRNRAAWWPNMVENVQRQRWQNQRLVWIVVDDSDSDQQLTTDVAFVRSKAPTLNLIYAQTNPELTTLGAKRNYGVDLAIKEGVDAIVMMDDDDYYPEFSVAERLRWLYRSNDSLKIVACATLPVYDITRYISAMNVPPLTLSPKERISEATVAFLVKETDEIPRFSETNSEEGSGLFVGLSAEQFRELPPHGIIVSFIHSTNTSSRRIPTENEPNGCHYGLSDDYFKYIHTIGGTESL